MLPETIWHKNRMYKRVKYTFEQNNGKWHVIKYLAPAKQSAFSAGGKTEEEATNKLNNILIEHGVKN